MCSRVALWDVQVACMHRLQGGSVRGCDHNGMKIKLFVGDMGVFNDEVASCTRVSKCVMEFGCVL